MDRVVNTPVTITVASIKPVLPGKKMGAVYDIGGQRWGVWGNQLQNFTEGGVYKILSYKENEFAPPGSAPMTMRTIGDFEYIGAPTPAARRATQAAKSGDAPNYSPPASDNRSRDIFVCGAVNHLLGNPNVTYTEADLVVTVQMLKRVWEATLGPNAPKSAVRPAQNQDMNDDIPFEGAEPEGYQ